MSEPSLSPVTHDDLVADIHALARALDTDDWKPDFIVGIGRGGLVPGAYLSHRTGITLLSVDHSSRLSHFSDRLIARLAEQSAQGERIMFVDDINDSGSTIRTLRAMIAAGGGIAGNVRFAVLLNNVNSASTVEYWSRTIDRRGDKRWFVFPWEEMADHATIVAEAGEVPERLA